MNSSHDKTEPNMPPVRLPDDIIAPPRFLFWGVIALFVLMIGGFLFGIFAFNNIFSGETQQRFINHFPWMENFQIRAPTPQGGILPTIVPGTAGNTDALNLLNLSISGATATPAATDEATRAGMVVITDTATPLPTHTATPVPTNTPTPAATLPPTTAPAAVGGGTLQQPNTASQAFVNLPASHRNFGFRWEPQKWNNCGPATMTTALTYFGWVQDQDYARERLRPNREDKNVSPYELVAFVNQQSQVRAIWRMGGSIDLLRALIAGGFPVMIERGMMFEANDWLGHYQALVAYDDSQGVFYAYDSFLGDGTSGEGEPMRYPELDEDWKAFNHTFIVIYQPAEEAHLQSILADRWTAEGAAEFALDRAQQDARANQTDGFAWHNIGTSLTALGRYQEAATAFDLARQTQNLPWRILWYQFSMFEAYYQVGRYDDVLSLVQSNLNQASELEESYYWRGMALAAEGNTADATTSFRTALRYNPHYSAASQALASLNG